MLWVLIIRRDVSNEYPQHMFLWRNKKKYPLIITKYSFLTIPLLVGTKPPLRPFRQFLWLDLVNINVYMQLLSKYFQRLSAMTILLTGYGRTGGLTK